MIVKIRDKPYYLMQLQSLEQRLCPNHHKIEEVRIAKINELTGLKGEKKIDFPLSFLNTKQYQLLHQLRLHDTHGFFQIDSLILHKNFVLILEVKNWFGKLLFAPNNQVIRINEQNEEDGFPNPIQQVKLQMYRFQNWLHQHDFSNVPLTYFIVIADPRTIIKNLTPQDKIPDKIIYSNHLFFEIEKLKNKYHQQKYSYTQLNKLSMLLKRSHSKRQESVLHKFHIAKNELITGVACPSCHKFAMEWQPYRSWICHYCQYKSRTAHINALKDYLLLINNKVTNKQMRKFLLINSPSTMKYILKKKCESYYGKTKGRYYKLTL